MRHLPVPGDAFGDYVIERELGRGAMGLVYLASQGRLGRQVALKLLSPELDEPEFRNRFEREARTLARLHSQYVVTVHDFGEHDGWLYLTNDYLPLGDLQMSINTARFEPAEALRLLGHMAAGLAAAHRVNILHRDIKPSNILLNEEADGVRALLADFGIARDTNVATAGHTAGVLGTFAFMPPERLSGAPADSSADVYALGCVLWAMLEGRPPFTNDEGDVLLGQVFRGPRPVFTGQLAGRVNMLLQRCLAVDPSERIADGTQLREVLAEAAAGRDDGGAKAIGAGTSDAQSTKGAADRQDWQRVGAEQVLAAAKGRAERGRGGQGRQVQPRDLTLAATPLDRPRGRRARAAYTALVVLSVALGVVAFIGGFFDDSPEGDGPTRPTTTFTPPTFTPPTFAPPTLPTFTPPSFSPILPTNLGPPTHLLPSDPDRP